MLSFMQKIWRSANDKQLTDKEIDKIASLYTKKNAYRIWWRWTFYSQKIYLYSQQLTNFRMRSLLYALCLCRHNSNMLQFIESLREVFKILLRIARLNFNTDNNYVPFIFTCTILSFFNPGYKIEWLNVQYLLDTFARTLNSGDSVVVNGIPP